MFWRSVRIGFFLTLRYLRRGSVWASLLIVAIMLLTFLNVVVVRGVLVGLPVGASVTYQEQYAGQVLITSHADQRHLDHSQFVEQVVANTAGYRSHSARYLSSGVIRANYVRPQKESLLPDQVGATAVGIDPTAEHTTTSLADFVVEGRYLDQYDTKGILVGSQLLERYAGGSPVNSAGTPETSGTISNVYPGDTVRLTLNGIVGEYEVVGVLESKVGENSRRMFMLDSQLRKVLDRSKDHKDEIAVVLAPEYDAAQYVVALRAAGLGEYAVVQEARDSQGEFLDDITQTFDLLGTGIGFIGIVVAAITVFIMIFIVAMNRQKQIGILKGIGINRGAILLSYVFLSAVYAAIGISLGIVVLYTVVAPFIAAHPIDFPFADGILVAPWDDTLARSIILVATTLVAGYVPARMIVQKNTINAILGR